MSPSEHWKNDYNSRDHIMHPNLKLNYEQSTLPEIRKKLRHIQSHRHRTTTTATVVKNLRALRANVEGGAR